MTDEKQLSRCTLARTQQIPQDYKPVERSFALDGIEKGARVAVAMSGGVDSSVTAALMQAEGYEVIGITLQLYDHAEMTKRQGSCCAGQDIYDARRVAEKLGFAHYVLDYESVFQKRVIDDFADSYLKGETPIPCIRCNQQVKFKDLLQTAKDLEAQALVTGHYVKRTHHVVDDRVEAQMHQAYDKKRDQSYFLFTTTQEQLNYLRFPLGVCDSKIETRYYARQFGLTVASKPDSQDICFVPNGNYVDLVAKLRPGAIEPGEIVHVDGTVLGLHQGIIHYTIGQRKGLKISSSHPLYVIRLDPQKKQVIVGPKEYLAVHSIFLDEVNWLSPKDAYMNEGLLCQIKIRSSAKPVAAIVQAVSDTMAKVTFINPEYGVALGQAGVFYQDDRVLGGGWICQNPTEIL